jgi:hypothetical protein
VVALALRALSPIADAFANERQALIKQIYHRARSMGNLPWGPQHPLHPEYVQASKQLLAIEREVAFQHIPIAGLRIDENGIDPSVVAMRIPNLDVAQSGVLALPISAGRRTVQAASAS